MCARISMGRHVGLPLHPTVWHRIIARRGEAVREPPYVHWRPRRAITTCLPMVDCPTQRGAKRLPHWYRQRGPF